MPVRFVRAYQHFTSAELEAGDVELEYVPPDFDEPVADEQTEPWCWGTDKPEPDRLLALLLIYRQFLER